MTPKVNHKTLGIDSNFLAIGRESSEFDGSRIVVLPIPYEHTVSYGKGTKSGPRAIIKSSHYVELYDEELDAELCRRVGIATLEPLRFGKAVDKKALNIIYQNVSDLLHRNKFVVSLGGEHTISQATIKAHLEKYPDLSVLQVDAHSDLRDSYEGSKYSHASVMARVCEFLDPTRIVQVGIRAQCSEEALFIRQNKINTIYAHQIRSDPNWIERATATLSKHVYVTFDVDGLDPSIMPGTGTPEPNGLMWSEAMELIRRVARMSEIVGMDVVEVSPIKRMGYSEYTAAKLTYKMMNYAFMNKK